MNKGLTIRVVVTIALAIVILLHVDWRSLAYAVMQVNVTLYALSAAVFLGSFGLLALRLKVLLTPTSFKELSLTQILSVHVRSVYYGFVMPSDIGTAVSRWYLLTKNQRGRSLIALITLLERLLMLATSSLFAAVALFIASPAGLPGISRYGLALFGSMTVVLAVIIVLLLSRRLFAAVMRGLGRLAARYPRRGLEQPVERIRAESEFHQVRSVLGRACLVQLVYQGVLVLRFVLLFLCLGLEFSVAEITWISMAVVILTTIPISFAGLGVREGGFAALLSLYSVEAEVGVLLGLLAFSQLVLAAAWGGLISLAKPH